MHYQYSASGALALAVRNLKSGNTIYKVKKTESSVKQNYGHFENCSSVWNYRVVSFELLYSL